MIPNSIVIPKFQNAKNIPTESIPISDSEPNLKASPEIKLSKRDFTLIEFYKVIPILYIDKKDSKYGGISLISENLKSDLIMVTGDKIVEEGKKKIIID